MANDGLNSNTGERVIPLMTSPKNGLLREHIARYKFAGKYVWGRTLDLACGVGYGCEIMLRGPGKWLINEIIGVDNDLSAIKYAKKYYSSPKTKYLVEDALDEKLVDKIGKFNSIVSFETIEHLQEDEFFIKNLKSLLLDEGILIISTPLGRGRKHPCSNPFHFFQYTLEEFESLLKISFSHVDIFLQINNIIEKPKAGKQYYLVVAICTK
ncbi:MAG: SAM-dependent methyltransferase [Clostridiaceae bacterium BRH_c20a]|nr:MAG: SAM-dependent methyltransferase [Clostridiaceae bacterium BRH_c20a]